MTSFFGTIKNGKLPEQLAQKIASLLRVLDGKYVEVAVKERKKTRSGQQNRYWFGVVVRDVTIALREHGNMVDEQEVHYLLKKDIAKLKRAIVMPEGEVHFTVPSSADLTSAEFSKMVEAVRAWALDVLGLDIPSPREYEKTDNNMEKKDIYDSNNRT